MILKLALGFPPNPSNLTKPRLLLTYNLGYITMTKETPRIAGTRFANRLEQLKAANRSFKQLDASLGMFPG